MDLGLARLRKIGINNLRCAVHPHHGVIWTDGKGIYLAPIQVEGHHVQNATSMKVGEFEHVTSVHWSSATYGDSCHMCVVHLQNVTVWRVSGTVPKLNFKQVRKINVRPVPQGCLWNPCNDVLCLLSRHQCSFYFRHDVNKGSYAFPALESGSIACGSWSPDGKKLVLCVGSALLIYRWTDVNTSIDGFAAAAWRIPGLEGKLTSIAPVLKDSVVVAAEIPLESLCKQQDVFKVPGAHGDGQNNNDGVIRPNKTTSVTESLLNLKQYTQAVADSRSSLTLIHLHDGSRDPIKLSTVPLKDVPTPDILMYEKSSQCVIVGSNSQSQLHIYALLEKHLAYCGNIQLDTGQRPKGLCSMPTFFDDRGAALLILVGQREVDESAIMAPSIESEFRLSLKYIILKVGNNHYSRQNGHEDNIKERFNKQKRSSLPKSENMKTHHVENLSDSSVNKWSDSGPQDQQTSHTRSSEDDIKMPASSSTEESPLESEILLKTSQNGIIRNGHIIADMSSMESDPESLETDTVSFSSQTPSFNNSKLAAEYSLDHVPSSRPHEQTDGLHLPVPEDKHSQENVQCVDEDAENISSSWSSQTASQSSVEKYAEIDHKSQEVENSGTSLLEKQETCSKDTASNYSHSQNSPDTLSCVKDDIFPKYTSTYVFTRLSDSTNNFPILESEILPQTVPTSSKTARDSPDIFPSLESEIVPETVPTSSRPVRFSPDIVPILESEIIPQTVTSSKPVIFSIDNFPILESEIVPQTVAITSSRPARFSPDIFPSLESEIIPQTVATSSKPVRFSLDNFPILESEIIPQTVVTTSKPIRFSPDIFPSLESEIIPQTLAITSKTVTFSSDNFPILEPEITSETVAPTSKSARHSPDIFPSLESEIIPLTVTSSKSARYFPGIVPISESEIIPQTVTSTKSARYFPGIVPILESEIIPQTVTSTKSARHFPGIVPISESEIIPQTVTSSKSARYSPDIVPISESEIISHTVSTSKTAGGSPDNFESEIIPHAVNASKTARGSPDNFESEIISHTVNTSKTARGSPDNFESKIISYTVNTSKTARGSPDNFESEIISHTVNTSKTARGSPDYNLQSDIKPQTTSDVIQTTPNIKPKITSVIQTSPNIKPQTTSNIKPQTTSVVIQTTPNIKPQTTSNVIQTTPDVIQTSRDSPDQACSLKSDPQPNTHEERIQLSDVDHSLRTQDVDPAREDLGFESSYNSADSMWEALDKQTKSQKDSIDALHHRLELLSTMVEETACVFPTHYQDMNEPETIEIYCEKPEGTETKRFLLDNGRLQLDPIKLSFGLSTVELWLDGIPCVLGANIDGYIPLKFSPSTKLQISGKLMGR